MILSRRFIAAGLHLIASAAVAVLAAAVIFLLWFPSPFAVIAGGAELFLLVMSVDVVAGPALTFVAASPGKPRKALSRDLAMIAIVQLSALAYGLYTVSLARPVVVAFEVDRFRVVSAAEIDPASLGESSPEFRSLSWTGPRQLAAVKPIDPAQQLRSIDLGLAGVDLSMEPRNWRPYASEAARAWRTAKPIQAVIQKYPQTRVDVESFARETGQPASALRYLPLQARKTIWTAVLAEPGARIVGYLPVDGFL